MSDDVAQLEQPQNRLAVARKPGGHFAKGTSGNPGGRSTQLEKFRRMCRSRKRAALAALDQAMAMVETEPMVAVSAAKAVLEFGFGKAPMELAITLDDTRDVDDAVSTRELHDMLDAIRCAMALPAKKAGEP